MTVVAAGGGRDTRSRAGELLSRDRWSHDALRAHQAERLDALLRHAIEHSDYYREALGSDAAERPLESLPTLSKAVLMDEFDRVVTDKRLRRADLEVFLGKADAGAAYLDTYYVFATAGTTGIPGMFVYSQAEFAEWVSLGLAALVRAGVTERTRLAAIGAPSPIHITRRLFADFQSSGDVPRLAVTTPLPDMVAALEVYRPEAVIAYASVMAALADEQLEGRLDIAPRVAITTSEVLTEDAGRRIEEAWGIRPTGAYAATEAPGIATGSPEDVGMHVWEDVLVLEVIGSDGRHVPPGEPGSKVLLTNLVNRTQPLIRYELADSVVLAEGPDPTGRPWLRIARVDGRSDDILSLPARGGGEVLVHPYRLRSPFARMAQVSAYQIIQRDEDVLIRVVARTGAGRGLPDDVAAAVSSALAEADAAVPVSVALVPEIEREPGTAAKVKLVKARPRRSRNT